MMNVSCVYVCRSATNAPIRKNELIKRERKKDKRRLKFLLIEVIKNDIAIKGVTTSVTEIK